MKVAYLDTSCLVAIAFGEAGAAPLARRMARFDVLAASDLLEAELRSAFVREGVEPQLELLTGISWVVPDRPLHEEIASVLAAGYVRGADCWHLACALYVAEDAAAISFLTLDQRQAAVAKRLGFRS
jgi:predicted nucleic acid-binding protein